MDIPTVIDPSLTFDRFVLGPSNKFAFAASLSVSEKPAGRYNPLFIHGKSGLGKTHLLHAIANSVQERHPDKAVNCLTCEDFFHDFARAIDRDERQTHRDRYRATDVLLVDEVQYLSGKGGLQTEFQHTFDAIRKKGGQIVMSANLAPQSILKLRAGLRGRLTSGLAVNLQEPPLPTRLAILRQRASESSVDVPAEVLAFVADHKVGSVRELEGALTKVIGYADLTGEPCTYALATHIIGDSLNMTLEPSNTAERIIAITSSLCGVTIADITGGKRSRPLVDARHIAMYVTRQMTKLSYPDIGREFGGRDHTTVLHAVRRVEQDMNGQRQMAKQVQAVMAKAEDMTHR